MCESRTNYKASLCKQWKSSQAWPSWMNDTVSPSPSLRVFARGRLPTMPRACVYVLRAFSRAGVRAFASGRLPTMPRAWPSCVRAHVHACWVRTWTSVYDACVRGRLAFVLTCMCAACVCACVRGRIACVRGCIHVYVPSILHVSSFDFLSVPDRHIIFLVTTAINIHILMNLIKGNTAKIIYLGLLQPTSIYIVIVHSIAYVISMAWSIPHNET